MSEGLSSNLKATSDGGFELRKGQASGNIGSLNPGESKSYTLSGSAREPKEVRACLRVDLPPELCATRSAEFGPLAALEPKAKAVWKGVVKAKQAADARFEVFLTSEQSPRPVEKPESTHFVVQIR